MTDAVFDHFSMSLPAGWLELTEEVTTYSDPTERERRTFARPGGTAVLHVSLLALDPDNPPAASADYALTLARDWGRLRGCPYPLSTSATERDDQVIAGAEYRLAGEYIAVYYLSNGEATLHASFITSWKTRKEEIPARDQMISTLMIG
ncbi:MAG: hypothetical protein R3B70_19955 [Polyangiaceae bacterium]